MKLFNLNQPSLSIILIPFYSISYTSTLNFKLESKFLIFISTFLLIDIIVRLIFRIDKTYLTLLNIFFILLFYYEILFKNIIIITLNGLHLNVNEIRNRYLLIFCTIFITITLLIIKKRVNIFFYLLNFFCITFGLIVLCNASLSTKKKKNEINKLTSYKFRIDEPKNKPIILIIIDEYASPIEIYKITKEKNVFLFADSLKSNNWSIKSNIYSYNKITLNSISSIFNYNFKGKDENLDINKSKQLLYQSSLYDSLTAKNIKFINYGIFDIGKTKAMYKIHFYEEEALKNNFWGVLFSKTLLNNLKIFGMANNQNKLNQSNIEINLTKLLKGDFNNSFVYMHLLMPHEPYEYHGKVNFKLKQNSERFKAYSNYWKFTNLLLFEQLRKLSKTNKYKIIISGDHGFKFDLRINPHSTFSAFYGFKPSSIQTIKSVQDIGNLINNSY